MQFKLYPFFIAHLNRILDSYKNSPIVKMLQPTAAITLAKNLHLKKKTVPTIN